VLRACSWGPEPALVLERMTAIEEHGRTIGYAETAMGQITALRQPATPRNYEIWYTYATNHNPELNQTINDTLVREGQLSVSPRFTTSTCRPFDSAIGSTKSAHGLSARSSRSCR
jgi:hypothetical protein